jgi:hypothetical protein
MDKKLIDQLWNQATRETLQNGTLNERYHFAKLVRDDYSNKHAQLWLKRIDEAVKAEREAIERVVGVAMLGADYELFKRVLGAIRARSE